jgi:hypothetical protein
MKISLDYKAWYRKAGQNIGAVLLGVLVLLLLMEAWTVKSAWGVLSDSSQSTLLVPVKLIRINFTSYNFIAKRVQDAATYAPQPFVSKNPFGTNEKPDNASGSSSTNSNSAAQ